MSATSVHSVQLFGLDMLKFRFHAIQLNTLDWRTFLKTPNPIASALMVKMQIAPEDRPHVNAQCARMIATLTIQWMTYESPPDKFSRGAEPPKRE